MNTSIDLNNKSTRKEQWTQFTINPIDPFQWDGLAETLLLRRGACLSTSAAKHLLQRRLGSSSRDRGSG